MEKTAPKPFAFILMPFEEEFDDIYQLGIKPACDNAGAYAERVDEQIFQGSILERIYNQIAKADVVIADMTGRNPNVFYETGYAHAIGKPVILLTQNKDDIPFDLRHYPHIIYKGKITELNSEVEKRLTFLLNQTSKEALHFIDNLSFFIDGKTLEEKPEISSYYKEGTDIYLKIDAQNVISKTIKTERFQVSIETNSLFKRSRTSRTSLRTDFKYTNTVKQSNGKLLHIDRKMVELLPGAWESIHFALSYKDGPHIG